jgi:catechol 2,3-dioxygenase-like lactoylglutathione lyase family enzyme
MTGSTLLSLAGYHQEDTRRALRCRDGAMAHVSHGVNVSAREIVRSAYSLRLCAMMERQAMIKGINHIGISVSNLERSIGFYRELLGAEVAILGAFSGERYDKILGLEGATGQVALLRSADIQVELFEFSQPAGRKNDRCRPVSDHGITHFCLEVADIEAEYQRMQALGAYFHCPPLLFPGAGKATYGRDPDGNVFELFERLPTGDR